MSEQYDWFERKGVTEITKCLWVSLCDKDGTVQGYLASGEPVAFNETVWPSLWECLVPNATPKAVETWKKLKEWPHIYVRGRGHVTMLRWFRGPSDKCPWTYNGVIWDNITQSAPESWYKAAHNDFRQITVEEACDILAKEKAAMPPVGECCSFDNLSAEVARLRVQNAEYLERIKKLEAVAQSRNYTINEVFKLVNNTRLVEQFVEQCSSS